MTELNKLKDLDHNVLEIIGAGPAKSVPTLSIYDQIKQMSQITKKEFSLGDVKESLHSLHKHELVEYIKRIDSWKLSESGKDMIQ